MTTHLFPNAHLAAPRSSAHPRTARRIGSVLAGLLTIFAFSTATDLVLHATGTYPPFGETMSDALFVLATAYRVIYGIAGCYLTARLAPYHPLWHALALGVLGFILSVAGAFRHVGRGPAVVLPRHHRHAAAVLVGRREPALARAAAADLTRHEPVLDFWCILGEEWPSRPIEAGRLLPLN